MAALVIPDATHAEHLRKEFVGDVKASRVCPACVIRSQRASRASTTWKRVHPAACASWVMHTKR